MLEDLEKAYDTPHVHLELELTGVTPAHGDEAERRARPMG